MKIAVIAMFAALVACGAEAPGEGLPPFVLVTTTDTPPYSYSDPVTGEVVGLEIDIAREAAARLGRGLEIRKDVFPNLLHDVSCGIADMAASGITITKGRSQAVDFTVPYATEGGMFIYRAGEPMPTMITAEGMRVGVMDASTYDFYLSAHGIDPIRLDAYKKLIKALKERRIDTIFYDSCSIKNSVAESGGELAASRMETRENFGIAVRKGNTVLKKVLDDVITERKAAE